MNTQELKNNIEVLRYTAISKIAECLDLEKLKSLRVKYLGRNGEITDQLKLLKDMSLEEKKEFGPLLNNIKKELEEKIEEKKEGLFLKNSAGKIDITQPGKKMEVGHLHPLTRVKKEIEDIFGSMGFSVADSPEVENDFYNFEGLNFPPDHPARAMHDTFWLKEKTLDKRPADKRMILRTHTSNTQVRFLEKNPPPTRIIHIGKVFRYENIDAGHEIQFHQFESLMVDRDISFANFKAVIKNFFEKFFSRDVSMRLRSSYFPFVEPGVEIDITCPKCLGARLRSGKLRRGEEKSCGLCSSTGWIEIAGAGMVHENVFKSAGLNPKDWQGFAFGFGLDRIAMVKYNIPDIRLFYNGDLRFLEQF